jgi:hypothetical protein
MFQMSKDSDTNQLLYVIVQASCYPVTLFFFYSGGIKANEFPPLVVCQCSITNDGCGGCGQHHRQSVVCIDIDNIDLGPGLSPYMPCCSQLGY